MSAFQQAKDMLAQKLDQLSKTTIKSQRPGGLKSPIPQREGSVFNTPKPIITRLKNYLRPPQQISASIKQERKPFWDSTNGAKIKQFNNKEDFEAAKKFFAEARGETYASPTPVAKTPQGSIKGVRVRNPRAKFTPKSGPANIDPRVQSFLEETVFPITRKAGIHDAVAAGQFAGEGRFTGLGANRNNFYNINAVDKNPNLAYGYDTPQAGVEGYADLIKRKYAKALETEDPREMLQFIQELNYAGDPATYAQRSDSGYGSYSDFVSSTPEYRYYSQQ